MKILYVNMRSAWTVRGHRFFDMRVVGILTGIADVDVLASEQGWYSEIPEKANLIVCHDQKKVQESSFLNAVFFHRGFLKRLSIQDHLEAQAVFRYVRKLIKKKRYDAVIVSTYDVIHLAICTLFVPNFPKFFLIEHNPGAYQKESLRWFYNQIKNRFWHICMEKDGIAYLSNICGIERERIEYIPHPMNRVDVERKDGHGIINVVGISNSNSSDEVQKIINEETKNHFFEKNKIKALFRTKELYFDDGWLKVIAGHVNMTLDEYYSYIENADLVILCFPTDFGIRTSGTIIDALSNNKPVLGSDFATMRQYAREYPKVCFIYEDIKDLLEKIMRLLSVRESVYTDATAYLEFKKERIDEQIALRWRKVIAGKHDVSKPINVGG